MACAVPLPTAAAATLTDSWLTVALLAGVAPVLYWPMKPPAPTRRETGLGGPVLVVIVKAQTVSGTGASSAAHRTSLARRLALCKPAPPRRGYVSRRRGDIKHRVLGSKRAVTASSRCRPRGHYSRSHHRRFPPAAL